MKKLFTAIALISPLFFSAANAAYPTIDDVKPAFKKGMEKHLANKSGQSITEEQKQQQAATMEIVLSMISFDSIEDCQGDENATVTCKVTVSYAAPNEPNKKETKTDSINFTKDEGQWVITD